MGKTVEISAKGVGLASNLKSRLQFGKTSRLGTFSLHIMMLPIVILLFIYAYIPMMGVVIAFQDFDVGKGPSAFLTSEWVGLENFRRIFSSTGSLNAIVNTLQISLLKMATMFLVPVIVALMLNEIRKNWIKRSVQTLVYLPHFLSWVVLGGIVKDVLSSNGILNSLLNSAFGMEPIRFLMNKEMFPSILILTNIWKEFGFSTIIFMAAIVGIDPTLYESAIVDGANRWKQTWHITLPGMSHVIVLTLVLSLGNILNAGFDQVFNLYSVPVYETGDIIDTFVYRTSFLNGNFSLGTAVGLFKSVVSFIMVTFSYWAAYKFANYEIF